jgi:hypothetical protein
MFATCGAAGYVGQLPRRFNQASWPEFSNEQNINILERHFWFWTRAHRSLDGVRADYLPVTLYAFARGIDSALSLQHQLEARSPPLRHQPEALLALRARRGSERHFPAAQD